MAYVVKVYTVVALCSYGLCSCGIYSHGRYSDGAVKLGHRESFLRRVVDEIIVSNNLEVCLVLEDGQVQDTLLHRRATYATESIFGNFSRLFSLFLALDIRHRPLGQSDGIDGTKELWR